MFSNQIFICHTDDHKEQAASIAISLRNRGYRVFLDKDTLPPGQSYDRQIEKAIKQSSAFVFLISPQSVREGRYTLTELKFAAKKWPSPANVVLPVLVAPTDLNMFPVYLKGATMLEPHGSLSAEVSGVIASMVSPRSYSKILGIATAIAVVVGIGIYAISSSPNAAPDAVYTPAQPSYSAVAECTRTSTVGKGAGDSEQDAKDSAVGDCEDNGGPHGCCKVIDVRQE
jgi:hypothetical protein